MKVILSNSVKDNPELLVINIPCMHMKKVVICIPAGLIKADIDDSFESKLIFNESYASSCSVGVESEIMKLAIISNYNGFKDPL